MIDSELKSAGHETWTRFEEAVYGHPGGRSKVPLVDAMLIRRINRRKLIRTPNNTIYLTMD